MREPPNKLNFPNNKQFLREKNKHIQASHLNSYSTYKYFNDRSTSVFCTSQLPNGSLSSSISSMMVSRVSTKTFSSFATTRRVLISDENISSYLDVVGAEIRFRRTLQLKMCCCESSDSSHRGHNMFVCR